MKIIKEDQNLMVIKENNILVFVVGVIFFVGGLIEIFYPEFFNANPPIWWGIMSTIAGMFAILFGQTITITLDKNTELMTFLKWKLIKKDLNEYALNKIKEIELQQFYAGTSGEMSGQSRFSYEISFIMDNGQRIPLNPGITSARTVFILSSRPKEAVFGQRIANFLGVTFQEKRPPTLSETLSTVQSAIQDSIEKEMEKRKKE